MTAVVEFKVGMTCGGCSSAVERILKKVPNVGEVVCDVDAKSVIVKKSADAPEGEGLDADLLLQKLEKWGKAAEKSVELVKSE